MKKMPYTNQIATKCTERRPSSLMVLLLCILLLFSCIFTSCKRDSGAVISPSETIDPSENKFPWDGDFDEKLDFENELPIIYLTTSTKKDVKSKTEYIGGTFKLDANGQGDIGEMSMEIRGRGNFSWGQKKTSYRIRLSKKTNVLNLAEGPCRSWVLIANSGDRTLLRNFATYKFARELSGIEWTPNCTSVHVFLNGSYRGVYLLVEQVQENKYRVNLDMSNVTTSVDTGYLLELTNYADETAFVAHDRTYNIKSDLAGDEELKDAQSEFIREYLENALFVLGNGTMEEVAELIDINSLVDVYILEEVSKNLDCGWDSFNLVKKAGGNLYFGPAWDFDLALGNADSGCEFYTGFYAAKYVREQSNPWLYTAMARQWFRELVILRWNELAPVLESYKTSIENEASLKKNDYLSNFDIWKMSDKIINRETELVASIKTYDGQIEYVTEWLSNRIAWLDEHMNSEEFLSGEALKDLDETNFE